MNINAYEVSSKLFRFSEFLESESLRSKAVGDEERYCQLLREARDTYDIANNLFENGFPK